MKTIPDSIIRESASAFGLEHRRLAFLGGGQDWSDGTVWRHPAPEGEHVLKILDLDGGDRQGIERAQQRLTLVRHLAQAGARIAMPLPGADGRLFAESTDGNKRYLAYTYPLAPGRHPDAQDQAFQGGGLFRALGSALGQLHRAAESHPAAAGSNGACPAFPALGGWRAEHAFFRDWCREERVRRAWDRLGQALAALPVERGNYGFVHNDAHLWNLLIEPGTEPSPGGEPAFTLIDFDVANYHWFMADAAIALYSCEMAAGAGLEDPDGTLPPGFRERCRSLFWEGYGRVRDPGPQAAGQLELFLQYRRCLLFMPFQEQSAGKPRWRKHWIARIEAQDQALFG